MKFHDARECQPDLLRLPTYATPNENENLPSALTTLLADIFALYLKTKNFHWHVSGPHFRDYHLLFDQQATQILAATDLIAERVRKIGGVTLRSIGQIARLQRLRDSDADALSSTQMLIELRNDNDELAERLRETRALCDVHMDYATASLVEAWIDEAEGRAWHLREAARA